MNILKLMGVRGFIWIIMNVIGWAVLVFLWDDHTNLHQVPNTLFFGSLLVLFYPDIIKACKKLRQTKEAT